MKNNQQHIDIKLNYEYTLDVGESSDTLIWKANKKKSKESFVANMYGNPDSWLVNKIVNKIMNSLKVPVGVLIEEFLDCEYSNYMGYQLQNPYVEIKLVSDSAAHRLTFPLKDCSVEHVLQEVLGFVGLTDYYMEVE